MGAPQASGSVELTVDDDEAKHMTQDVDGPGETPILRLEVPLLCCISRFAHRQGGGIDKEAKGG